MDELPDEGFPPECTGTVCRVCAATITCEALDRMLAAPGASHRASAFERARPDPPLPELSPPPDTLDGGGRDDG